MTTQKEHGYNSEALANVRIRIRHVFRFILASGSYDGRSDRILSDLGDLWDLKAWATRCLKENFDKNRDHWWAERGSIRYINDDDSLEAAIIYVRDAEDFRKDDSGLR